MSNYIGPGLIAVVVGLANTSVAQSVPPQSVTMQELTVPNNRLPDGCSLKVLEPRRKEVIATSTQGQTLRVIGPTRSMQPGGVISNPWTGTDRRILAELRQRVDGHGTVRVPDAPPLTRREASAMQLRFADGVEEGYAATYAQSGSGDLGVWAVRLAPAPDRRIDSPSDWRSNRNAVVVDIGLIRAALFGPAGACSTAIETHLKSLGK